MKKTILFSICLLSALLLTAQAPSFSWAKSIGGPSDEVPNRILNDAAGNTYVLGNYDTPTDFDPGPGTTMLTPTSGMIDAFLVKLDAAGNFVWARSFGSEFLLGLYQSTMDFDASGNIVIAGVYTSLADFDPGPATYTLDVTMGFSRNGYVLKLDANGNFLWVKDFAAVTDEGSLMFSDVKVDGAGNINVIGFYSDVIDFDPDPVTTHILTAPNRNVSSYAILRLNSVGDLVWAKSIDNALTIGAGFTNLSITTDQQNNVVFSGSFEGTVDLDPGAGSYTLTSSGSAYEGTAFIVKLDNSGNFIWARHTDCPGGTWSANKDLVCDNSGNVYICGSGSGYTDLDPGAAVVSDPTTTATEEGYLFKLDAAGNFVWGHFISGNNASSCTSLSLNAAGDLFIVGDYGGTFDFNGGPGTYTLTSPSPNPLERESFICSYNQAGNFAWANAFGGAAGGGGVGLPGGSSWAKSVSISNSNIYIAGYFNALGDYDPTAGTAILTPLYAMAPGQPFYSMDTYILKLSTCMAPPSPTNTTIPARLSICAGATTTLSVNTNSGTVGWYTSPTSPTAIGSGTVYVTPALAAGTYTYYADATTCAASLPRTAITVTATPFPVITASTFSSTICSGSTVTLTANASSAVNYSWSTGANTATITVSPTVTTTYTVTGTNACTTASTSITQYVSTCTGIDEYIDAEAISMYPNPASEVLSIAIPAYLAAESTIVEVTDALGKLVMKETLSHDVNSLNITSLGGGIYFIKVITNNQTFKVHKVVKH